MKMHHVKTSSHMMKKEQVRFIILGSTKIYFVDLRSTPVVNKCCWNSCNGLYGMGSYFLFILDISIVPLQVHYYSEALLTTALILCQSQHAEPATLRTQGTEYTTEPPRPMCYQSNIDSVPL